MQIATDARIDLRFDAAMAIDTFGDEETWLRVEGTTTNVPGTFSRGNGGRGYLPSADATPTCIVETLPPADIPSEPVSLLASTYAKIPASAIPVYKHCNGLNHTLARMEAAKYECFDALMLGETGYVCETTSANIFWVKNKTLFTPGLECGPMSGSIRAALLEISPYPVKEVRASVATLADADAVFLTNVAWKVLPVAELKPLGLRWHSENAAQFFLAVLHQDIKRYSEKYLQKFLSVVYHIWYQYLQKKKKAVAA